MKHSHSLRLLGVMSGVLVSMGAYALDLSGQPPLGSGPVHKAPAPAAAIAPQGAGDAQLGMALLGAFINADASVGFGSGVTGALSLGTGFYEIQFNRNITQCIYSANSFDSSNKVIQQLQPRAGNPNGVFLSLKTTEGTNTLVNGAFYVTVFCPR